MRREDVAVAEQLSDQSFTELDRRVFRRDQPDPTPRAESHRSGWIARTRHFLDTDPGGCWVADDGAGMVGFATSVRREGTWILATYAVRPGLQGRGIGKQVLDAALTHSLGCLHGMLSASDDPKALRRYLLAGFTMYPQMYLTGTVDRSAIPIVGHVRDGTAADTDLMDSLDRLRRGSGHGPDHAMMQSIWHWIVADSTTGSGYAYLDANGSVALLAASNRRTAARLLWTAIGNGPNVQTIAHITAANAWAIEIGTACRLDLHTSGYLALRGMKPPAPYVHNGALL